MSRLFGSIRQMGYVVRDVEEAMQHWIQVCGIGPWYYVDKLTVNDFHYRGQPGEPHLSIGLANSGYVQVELIQQRDDSPTMYQDFLNAGHEGLQHWSSWPEDFDSVYRQALDSGYEVGQEADSPRGRFVYFFNEGHPGTVIEMAHLSSERRRIFDAIREAAVDWEGAEPIRREWP